MEISGGFGKNQPRRWEELSAKEFMTTNPITLIQFN